MRLYEPTDGEVSNRVLHRILVIVMPLGTLTQCASSSKSRDDRYVAEMLVFGYVFVTRGDHLPGQ